MLDFYALSPGPEVARRHTDSLMKFEMPRDPQIHVSSACRSGGSIQGIYWYCLGTEETSRDSFWIKQAY